jgi:hypothetical protein
MQKDPFESIFGGLESKGQRNEANIKHLRLDFETVF